MKTKQIIIQCILQLIILLAIIVLVDHVKTNNDNQIIESDSLKADHDIVYTEWITPDDYYGDSTILYRGIDGFKYLKIHIVGTGEDEMKVHLYRYTDSLGCITKIDSIINKP